MKNKFSKSIMGLTLLGSALALSACGGSGKLDDYTIMIYMCGSDLESDYSATGDYPNELGLATANIMEIVSAAVPKGINVIIETGGAKNWETNYGVPAKKIGRFHVEKNTLVQDVILDNASMGKSATFQSFLEWGLKEYPAEKTGVILWNHGGAMDGCCYDENYRNDSLLNSEIHHALEGAFASTKRTEKLEWIGYDCCLMSVADIADFNSDYFHYMIASQESEPGEGWDYDSWLDTLYDDVNISTASLLADIADTYKAKCGSIYNSYGGEYVGFNDATMAVLDLSKMDAFSTAWESMAGQLDDVVMDRASWNAFESLVNACQRFGAYHDEDSGSTSYQFDIFDIQDFCDAIEAKSVYSAVTAINDVETSYQEVIDYNVYGKDSADASGLCFFCPLSGYTYASSYASSETNYSSWKALVDTYGSYY